MGYLDRSLARLSATGLTGVQVERLRWFWLDGLFGNLSGSCYGSFIPLFALAYGASNAQVGQLSGIASLAGLAALLPGAQAIKLFGGQRKGLVVLVGGILVRVLLLAWLLLPFFHTDNRTAIWVIIAANAGIALCSNFANPAWTAIVADIVPRDIRGRVFSHRSLAINLPALLMVPLAGLLIQAGSRPGSPFAGYQIVFALAIVAGVIGTYCFARIDDPVLPSEASHRLPLRDVTRSILRAPGFVSLLAGTFIWNFGVQVTGPFLNVYLVKNLGSTTAIVGWVAAAGSLTAVLTQGWLGRWVDRRGNIWVQGVMSLIIPFLPLAWMLAANGWQVVVINTFGGILWAGHALASFNLLLDMAPAEARAESYALFQVVVAASATLAPLLGGRLADAFGFPPIFILSSALRFVGAGVFLWWVARPALRRPPPPAASPTPAS